MDLTLLLGGQEISLLGVIALGGSIGIVAGMFGVGGGFLLVPALHVLLGVPLPYAVGAALCQTVATGTGSFLRYRRMGLAETRFDVMMMGGALLGVDAGARILELLEGLGTTTIAGKTLPLLQVVMSGAYLFLFTLLAAMLWFARTPAPDEAVKRGPLARVTIPPLVNLPVAGFDNVSGPMLGAIGLFNGVLAGLLGIGGGILLIPIMLYGFGFNVRKSAGTGILIVLAVAIVGTTAHGIRGNVHLGLVAVLMTGTALAAQVGAGLTRQLSEVALKRGLAVVLLLANAALIYKLLR